MPEITKPKPGRPKGQTKAAGHAVSDGRPAARGNQYDARLTHWRAWWESQRPVVATAIVVAERMEQKAQTIRDYATSRRQPPEPTLQNLERVCSAYGYAPLTSDHQFL